MSPGGIALVVERAAHVEISKMRVTAKNAKYTFSGGKLTIEGIGSVHSYGNGVSVNNNVVSINGMQIWCKTDCLQITGRVPSKIVINGTTYGPHGVLSADTEREENVDFEIPSESYISSIQVSGSGDVNVHEGIYSEGSNLHVLISGSGDVTVGRNQMEEFIAVVSGSGDIRSCITAERATLSVAGSGDIDGVYAIRSIQATCMGSGDIKASVSPTASVTKSKMGSGSISIKRRHEE